MVVGSSAGSPVRGAVADPLVGGDAVSTPPTTADLPDGSDGRVVEIGLDDGGWPEGAVVSGTCCRPPTSTRSSMPSRATPRDRTGLTGDRRSRRPPGRAGRRRGRRSLGRGGRLGGHVEAGGRGSPTRAREATTGADRRRHAGPGAAGRQRSGLRVGRRRGARGAGAGPRARTWATGCRPRGVHATPVLPAATSTPAPAPPSLAGSAPLQSHEIFGYAPYWTLPQSSGFDVQRPDHPGLLQRRRQRRRHPRPERRGLERLREPGPGRTWSTGPTPPGDRVVLTVTCFSQSSLDAITSDPNAAGPPVGGADRRGVGQEPRRGQLRLRG